jgi:chemotaxis protein methyltransferase CheR
MCQALRIGGFLIMGHAESLSGMDLPLAQANPTVYRRRNE